MYLVFLSLLFSPDMRSFPKSRFATMGGLDAIAGLFAVVGGALTAGQTQIVVQQANIPITMLLSRLYLKVSSYTWSQYVGAAVIVLGGLLSAFGSGVEKSGVSAHVLWFGPILILIGIFPGSMSNVYKEENFKSQNLDIYFLTTYVAVWQTGLSFLCVPLFSLSYFGGIPSE
jgi:drug/metabolite transporter (DMT)-like permease